MSEAGKTTSPIGSTSSMRSLRLKGATLPSRVQSGLKAIWVTLRLSAQQAAMRSAPVGVPPLDEHHVGMLGVHLIESLPDGVMIVAIHAAAKGDLRTGGKVHFGLGLALGREEVAAVDHGGGEVPVVDHGAGARAPGRAGVRFIVLGGAVAQHLEGAAPLDQRMPLGNQALELDGADFGAVLLGLRAALPILVVIELALHASALAMEQVGQRPQQIRNIGLKASVDERLGQGLEQGGNGRFQRGNLRQRTRIGLVVVQVMAMQLQLIEHLGGRAGLGKLRIERGGRLRVACHGKVSGKEGSPQPSRLFGDPLAGDGDGAAPRPQRATAGTQVEDPSTVFLFTRNGGIIHAARGKKPRAGLRSVSGSGRVAA